MKTNFYVLAIILLAIYSCSSNPKQSNLIDITSKMDESSGFVDLVLAISEKQETDSNIVYHAVGLYKSDTVGLKIGLKKAISAGIVNGEMKNVFIENGIMFLSVGEQSNKLLQAMTSLYDVDSINVTMRTDPILLTAANLNESDVNYNSGEYKFKVFMESETEVGELFVNFDFANNFIYLNEKDMEYRSGVLRYLMDK